ncbi:family 20 glycosylhydrolase [Algibacter amylolyticus]|uniref:Family 20 glycosylhydrolase n=1 Tax=Algibacter amylolyticus TaxID=1608400 RepID=A0A5M7AWN3_9FLAO|nr:family 20 glycosylhydrolase [Algibacter amylolyticus]KAA5821843.1 family 20 glycosylhydrolase [Algibacter amylolyticus]MBB5269360.1 hypothetical protein [Algibacter amylolyticus]TSJ73127.1 family 20 glycosylhydrolase [Algibacter amylolyticus]
MKKRVSVLLLIYVFIFSFTSLTTVFSQENKAKTEFQVKGFHLDLRIQVMTPKALKSFAKELAGFGINTLILEWEATYPYEKHATISNEFAYTRVEVKSFIDYCEGLGIDVIPLQQCFGHVEYILRNERYGHLKEDWKEISQVCPLKIEDNKALFKDLFKDMASMHNSDYIHIGGDETYLLGHCNACSAKAEEVGKSKLFVDYMTTMSDIILELGKKPIMWADIVLEHPEAADDLSKDIIFIDWNYGWETNHFGDVGNLQQKGFTFWGSPAIRSSPDNWYITNWDKHFNNQRDFIPYSRNAGYKGMVMTSWSTSGIYGLTVCDEGYKVLDMQQIRNVYPLSGFRILIASYAEALKNKGAIDPERFVISYAAERFGLNEKDVAELWRALSISRDLIFKGKPLAEIMANSNTAHEIFYKLKPLKNKKEFEHYRLINDLRQFYLATYQIETMYNSVEFSVGNLEDLKPKLEALKIESKKLDKRFKKLHQGFLYDSEIEDQNNIRNLAFNILYNRINKTRN